MRTLSLLAISLLATGCATSTLTGDEGDTLVRDVGSDAISRDVGGDGSRPDVGPSDTGTDPTSDPLDVGGDADATDADPSDTDATDVQVDVGNQAPTASVVLPIQGFVAETLIFDGSASSDPDGSIVQWQWQLGDGQATSGATASYAYAAAGSYDAQLEVTDDQGATDTIDFTVTVADPDADPIAIITLPADLPQVGNPATLSGAESWDPAGGTIIAWDWTLTSAALGMPLEATGETLSLTFDAAGSYDVELVIESDSGATGTVVETLRVGIAPTAIIDAPSVAQVGTSIAISATDSSDTDGSIVAYDWTTGDGTTRDVVAITHTYSAAGSYEIGLTITDNDGLIGTALHTIDVQDVVSNLPPIAEAGADQNDTVNTVLSFDGSASSDPDGSIATYTWNFGDGGNGTGATPTHTYTTPGTYIVTLTVTDDGGATDNDSLTVVVMGEAVNTAPVASFVFSPVAPEMGENVSFDGSASTDPDGTVVSYAWQFGDGAGASGVTANHAYVGAGTYTATLTVTDDDGATHGQSQMVTVTEPTVNYSGDFRVLPFDMDEAVEGSCTDFTITVSPANCNINVTGSSMIMTCGADTYRGTITGSDFTISLDRRTGYDANCSSDFYFTETITGTYVSNDRWEGTSTLALQLVDTFWCSSCAFDPFQKTANRQ